MLVIVDIVSLAVLGYIDYVSYKIPNVVLCAWVFTSIYLNVIAGTTSIDCILRHLQASLLVTGSFLPLRHIVKCNAGDFKLYGVLTLTRDLDEAMFVLLITLSFSFFPFASGIKKVQIALLTFFGYITFLFFKKEQII